MVWSFSCKWSVGFGRSLFCFCWSYLCVWSSFGVVLGEVIVVGCIYSDYWWLVFGYLGNIAFECVVRERCSWDKSICFYLFWELVLYYFVDLIYLVYELLIFCRFFFYCIFWRVGVFCRRFCYFLVWSRDYLCFSCFL